MAKVRWTPLAAQDLDGIGAYLQDYLPCFANQTIERIYNRIQSLGKSPHLGRVGREAGTRELVFSPLPYVAIYRVRDQQVEVLRVRHGAQSR